MLWYWVRGDRPSIMCTVFYNVLCLEYNVLYFNFLKLLYVERFGIGSRSDRPSRMCIVFYNTLNKN